MTKLGFDNEKYLKLQSEHIKERISHFDNKLYLEFGGKLLDDMHASRVLPGFHSDSKFLAVLVRRGAYMDFHGFRHPLGRYLPRAEQTLYLGKIIRM